MKKSDFNIPDGKLEVFLETAKNIQITGVCTGTGCVVCPFGSKYNVNGDNCVDSGCVSGIGTGNYDEKRIKSAKQFIKLFGGSMNFQEAFVEMLEGKKVRSVRWNYNDGNEFIQITHTGNGGKIVDERNKLYIPAVDTVEGDWEIWTPEKKVDITITMNGEKIDPKDISEETWERLRKK